MATLTYTATVAGLYTCSLYASTLSSPRLSSSWSPIGLLSTMSTPPAHLLPSPPPILSVVVSEPEPPRVANNAAKHDQFPKETLPAVVENSSVETPKYNAALPNETPKNTTRLCEIRMRSEDDVHLPSPWASWLFNTKAALAVWAA